MERLVVSNEGGIQDDVYLDAYLAALEGAPALMFANTYEGGLEVRCVVSVHQVMDPRWLRDRWAVVVSGDAYVVMDYVNREEARVAYRNLLKRCAADGVIWDITSDGWKP